MPQEAYLNGDPMQAPLVSVIVPVFNAERTLPRLMTSLLGQTLAALEIILVDDHSTDGSLALCRQYAQASPERVRVVTPQTKGYAGGCRNAGMDAARGTYVGFVDADDSVMPEMFAALAAAAEQAGAEVAVCGYMKICGDAREAYLPAPEISALELARARYLSAMCWNKLFLREWLLANAVRFPIKYAEDGVFVTEALSLRPRVAVVRKALYYYILQQSSFSTLLETRGGVLESLRECKKFLHAHAWNADSRALYRLLFFRQAIYYPACLLCIDSLWHGNNRWQNLRAAPAYAGKLCLALLREGMEGWR